jgi:hypothetical protein
VPPEEPLLQASMESERAKAKMRLEGMGVCAGEAMARTGRKPGRDGITS